MADFEYFRAEESDQFSFFRIPKALFTEKEFASLSTDAKLLYGILLDRISLSKKNGWIDSDGYVYIIYTIAELQELLRMSHTTVTKLLYELDSVHGIGLIERYRQGNNRPSVIYVKNFVKIICSLVHGGIALIAEPVGENYELMLSQSFMMSRPTDAKYKWSYI